MILKHPDRFWGFGYVRPRCEKRVQGTLNSMGISQYLPTIYRARLHHSTKVISQIPMFPGYIFLEADDMQRTLLLCKEERFVSIHLLRNKNDEELFIHELNAIQQCELLSRNAPVLVNPDIISGDEVEITSGPLEGLRTTVISRDDGQNVIIVNLTILCQHVEYPVSADLLKKITD